MKFVREVIRMKKVFLTIILFQIFLFIHKQQTSVAIASFFDFLTQTLFVFLKLSYASNIIFYSKRKWLLNCTNKSTHTHRFISSWTKVLLPSCIQIWFLWLYIHEYFYIYTNCIAWKYIHNTVSFIHCYKLGSKWMFLLSVYTSLLSYFDN